MADPLIEATHVLNGVLVQALTALGGWVYAASRGEHPLRADSRELTKETSTEIAATRELKRQAELHLAQLELLVGTDSNVYQYAYKTIREVRGVVNILGGSPRTQRIVQAVVAERESPGAGSALLPDAEAWYAFSVLKSRPNAPDHFDPADDVNVALWAVERHIEGGVNAHHFVQVAHAYIEAYRLE